MGVCAPTDTFWLQLQLVLAVDVARSSCDSTAAIRACPRYASELNGSSMSTSLGSTLFPFEKCTCRVGGALFQRFRFSLSAWLVAR